MSSRFSFKANVLVSLIIKCCFPMISSYFMLLSLKYIIFQMKLKKILAMFLRCHEFYKHAHEWWEIKMFVLPDSLYSQWKGRNARKSIHKNFCNQHILAKNWYVTVYYFNLINLVATVGSITEYYYMAEIKAWGSHAKFLDFKLRKEQYFKCHSFQSS